MEPSSVRHSVNSGTYFPIDQGELLQTVENSMNSFVVEEDLLGKKVRAAITPCAPYSVADELYASVYSSFINTDVDEIFIFADPLLHKLEEIAFSDYLTWEIPIGSVKQTHRLNNIVNSDDSLKDILVIDNSKHQGEIGIESQLPYIYHSLGSGVRLVPFMVGDLSPRLVTKYLSGFVDPEDILICVSNISSGIPADYAQESDEIVLKAISNLDVYYLENNDSTLTSPRSVALMCNIAKQNDWKPKLLDYSMLNVQGHMGDTNVGAASIVFIEE